MTIQTPHSLPKPPRYNTHCSIKSLTAGSQASADRQADRQTEDAGALAPTLEELSLDLNLTKMFILNILVGCGLIW